MKAICEVCGKEFSHWYKNRIVHCCSKECRIKRGDRIITCQQCGKEFRVAPARTDRKFCSQTCSNRFNQPPDASKKSIFTCKWCGNEFEEWTYRKPTFCSSQCRSEYACHLPKPWQYKPEFHVTLTCAHCGKEYQTNRVQKELRNSRFCSRECMYATMSIERMGAGNPLYTGGTLDISAYGPNWHSIKRKIIRRDHGTCRACGITGVRMDVHHIIKLKEFHGEHERANQPNNLLTVCRKCHVKLDHSYAK